MVDLHKLEEVAREVRAHAVEKNEDDELGYPDDLEGMCAIASTLLFDRLQKADFDPRIAYACNELDEAHVFVMVDDVIVDITASQFGLRDVEITKKGTPHSKRWFWKPQRKFSSVEQLIVRQKKDGWPPYQRVDEILELG